MCGLVAWVGEVPLDVKEMAFLAGGRGPHQHGWVTISDQIIKRSAMGPLTGPYLGSFTIGHSRLATSGSYSGTLPDVQEAQPYVQDGLVVAHNGVIHLEENKEYINDVDTNMLFEIDDPHEFLEEHHLDYSHNHALITATKNEMTISSFGQPLFIREDDLGLSVCSVETSHGDWEKVHGIVSFKGIGENNDWLQAKN